MFWDMCLCNDLNSLHEASKRFKYSIFLCPLLCPVLTSRPDDSAVWVDQQEWGAAGQKSVPPGHGAGGLGYPGALPRCAGCAVSSFLLNQLFPGWPLSVHLRQVKSSFLLSHELCYWSVDLSSAVLNCALSAPYLPYAPLFSYLEK